ncbi:MAG: hypothetical protein AB7G48_19625 [Nitrospiraceae bacterium]
MNCPRCQGFMVEDYFIDLQETMGPHWVMAMRCMNCGNVMESQMDANRRQHEASLVTVASELTNDVPVSVEPSNAVHFERAA